VSEPPSDLPAVEAELPTLDYSQPSSSEGIYWEAGLLATPLHVHLGTRCVRCGVGNGTPDHYSELRRGAAGPFHLRGSARFAVCNACTAVERRREKKAGLATAVGVMFVVLGISLADNLATIPGLLLVVEGIT